MALWTEDLTVPQAIVSAQLDHLDVIVFRSPTIKGLLASLAVAPSPAPSCEFYGFGKFRAGLVTHCSLRYTLGSMKVNRKPPTIQVSYRLPKPLVERMRRIVERLPAWPPPPSQTEIVTRGVESVLLELERQRP